MNKRKKIKRWSIYQQFIDALVELRPSVLKGWVTESGWPALPENRKFNGLLEQLTPEQKEVVAEMVQKGRDEGIFDVLVYISDNMRLSRNGVELAFKPYFQSMYEDWHFRCAGEQWEADDDNEEPD